MIVELQFCLKFTVYHQMICLACFWQICKCVNCWAHWVVTVQDILTTSPPKYRQRRHVATSGISSNHSGEQDGPEGFSVRKAILGGSKITPCHLNSAYSYFLHTWKMNFEGSRAEDGLHKHEKELPTSFRLLRAQKVQNFQLKFKIPDQMQNHPLLYGCSQTGT